MKSNYGSPLRRAIHWFYNTKSSTFTPRRLVFCGIFTCFLLYYMLPYFYHSIVGVTYSTSLKSCRERHLTYHEKSVAERDAVMHQISSEDSEKPEIHFPFVGNGKIGAAVAFNPQSADAGSLHIFHKNKEDSKSKLLNLGVNALIRPEYGVVDGAIHADESFVINFRQGIVEKLSCFTFGRFSRSCLFVNHTVIAHRSRPNIFLQRIELQLEASKEDSGVLVESHEIKLHQLDISTFTGFRLVSTADKASNNGKPYKVYRGKVEVDEQRRMPVVITTTVIPQHISVSTDKMVHADSITVVMHGAAASDENETELEELISRAVGYTESVLGVSTSQLLHEHRSAWSDILHTGLTLAHHNHPNIAPGIPDPTLVNASLYYILSSFDSKLHDRDIPPNERRDLMRRLQTPDFCYTGTATFHTTSKLWRKVASVADVMSLANLWALTLKYKGCKNLVSEGAEGMLQAFVLSFGGLQFTGGDLQLHTDPDILHNQLTFHSVLYKNNTVDIAIVNSPADDGLAEIMVQLRDVSYVPLYACEAGCVSRNPLMRLTHGKQYLPIYVTDPATPILYISHDKSHLYALRETLHLNNIVRYQEHFEQKIQGTGLPTIFWVGIGSLILIFHLFLIRMLIKEYYSSSTSVLPTHSSAAKPSTYSGSRGRLLS